MKEHVRTAIAYIAGKLISSSASSSIFNYSASRYTQFSGTVSPNNVSVYDYDKSCHISGTPQTLYHYGDSHYITLSISGSTFKGFDYGTSTHFSGNVNVRSISLFDYGEGKHFQYSI
jgi:hypothetical protein